MDQEPMTNRVHRPNAGRSGRGRRLAITLFVLTTGLYLAGFVLVVLSGQLLSLNEALLPAVYAFAVVGFLIALNRPGNAIAWICSAIGFVWALEYSLSGAATYGLVNPGTVPWPEALAAVGVYLWIPGVFGIGTFVFMFYPDGRLPSPRWRWLPWLAGVGLGTLYVTEVLSAPEAYGYGREFVRVENPFRGVLGPWMDQASLFVDLFEIFFFVAGFGAIGASMTALAVRFRRSRGIERQQIKWLVTAGSTGVVIQLISIPLVDVYGETIGLVAASFFLLIPISIGIAVLRYRLYDIDRLISRTVTYALVVGMLATVVAAIAIGLPQLLGLPDESPLLVAMATLAVAALFNPLRRRIQARVDHRFNRARYNAQQEVDRLAERLRTELELEDLTGEVIAVVDKTMQPTMASVWIRDGGETR